MDDYFRDRVDAGRQLAAHLADYAHRDDVVVLALPRGGVPVAFEVAKALRAPLDVLIVRKLGAPGNPELAMGAIAAGGIVLLEQSVLHAMRVTDRELADTIERERARKPAKLVAAVPVASPSSAQKVKAAADAIVCVMRPDWLMGIGQFYRNFDQTSDDEVCALLERAREWAQAGGKNAPPAQAGAED